MGREHYVGSKTFKAANGEKTVIEGLEFFTWEKLDMIEEIKAEFGI